MDVTAITLGQPVLPGRLPFLKPKVNWLLHFTKNAKKSEHSLPDSLQKKRCVTLHFPKKNAQELKCVCAFFVLAMPFVNYIYNVSNLLLRHARTNWQT